MNIRHVLVVLVLSVLTLGLAPLAQSQPAASGWTPELAMKVKRVSHVRVAPDGRHSAYVVGSAVMDGEKSEWLSHIYVARADGSNAFQLTQGDKSATSPEWSPDGRWIAFISARGEKPNAKANLWRIRLEGGEAEPLTEEKGGVSAFRWSPDGTQIAFLMSDPKTEAEEKAEKEKRDWQVVDENLKMTHLYVVPVDKNAEGKRPVRKLTSGHFSVGSDGTSIPMDWSPDGKWIAFSHQPTPLANDWTKGDISVVEVAFGTVRPLATTGAAEADPVFSPDGRWIAYVATDNPPTWGSSARVYIVPAAGGAPKPLADTYDQQPGIVGWSADGQRVLITEAYHTVRRLSALPANGGPPVDITPADLTIEGPALNHSHTYMGFTSQATDRAVEAFMSPADRFEPTPVSRVQSPPDVPLGKTETVTWPAPDGKTIEGLLTYPVGYRSGTRVPLLVIVHGGPTGVFVRSFTGAPSPYPVAVFAARGYAVLRCNVRGSSGYGRDFRYANYRDWGGGDYRDIMSGVDALIAKGIADGARLGIMGWSYGGYMTSWIITQTKRFKAASVGAGVTNLMSFTGTADIPDFVPDYFGGEYWDAFDRWRAHSAMFNVKGVTTPTLIQHGEADRRVPVSQGYEFYNALKRQGVPVRMVVYPRQPHGLQEPKFVLDAMQRNLEWFDRWVLGKEPAKETP